MVCSDESVLQNHWYALYARSRHERQVEERLKGKGIETFFPVRSLQRRWKDRKKIVEFPLFPGYLFVNISMMDRNTILQTPSVVRMIGNGLPEPIPDGQIIAVRKFLEAEIQFDPYPYLVPGMEVEVRRGPLKSVRGVLITKKNKHRLIINVNLINNCIATEIDAEDIQPV